MRNTVPTVSTAVPTGVTKDIGHVRRNQRSRCRNPCGHVHRNVGHDPGITGHVGPEYSVRADSIRLGYTANGQDASQTICTTTTPCRYGGARTWFQCPCCGGRSVVLFLRVGRFACRQCQKVSYSSQSGSAHDRANTRYHQLHALIEAGKPKWQRWTTFERLEERFERVSKQVNRSLMVLIQRLQAGR